jgi:hypothetical protein
MVNLPIRGKMKKFLSRVILIGLGMGILIFMSEAKRTSQHNAYWISLITITLWFALLILLLIILKLSSKPELEIDEEIIKEDWGSCMANNGDTFGGILYLTNKGIRLQPHLFSRSKAIKVYLPFELVTEITMSDAKLLFVSDDISYYFFLNDSASWKNIIENRKLIMNKQYPSDPITSDTITN